MLWIGSQTDGVKIMIFIIMAVCRHGYQEPGRGSRELLKMIGFFFFCDGHVQINVWLIHHDTITKIGDSCMEWANILF